MKTLRVGLVLWLILPLAPAVHDIANLRSRHRASEKVNASGWQLESGL